MKIVDIRYPKNGDDWGDLLAYVDIETVEGFVICDIMVFEEHMWTKQRQGSDGFSHDVTILPIELQEEIRALLSVYNPREVR